MIKLFFDGGCIGNGFEGAKATWGYVLEKNGKQITSHGFVPENELQSNNTGEYYGLIKALEFIQELRKNGSFLEENLEIYGDSNLVIKMVTQQWGWSRGGQVWRPHKDAPHLAALLERVHNLLDGIEWQAMWIPREQNEKADALTEEAFNSAKQ